MSINPRPVGNEKLLNQWMIAGSLLFGFRELYALAGGWVFVPLASVLGAWYYSRRHSGLQRERGIACNSPRKAASLSQDESRKRLQWLVDNYRYDRVKLISLGRQVITWVIHDRAYRPAVTALRIRGGKHSGKTYLAHLLAQMVQQEARPMLFDCAISVEALRAKWIQAVVDEPSQWCVFKNLAQSRVEFRDFVYQVLQDKMIYDEDKSRWVDFGGAVLVVIDDAPDGHPEFNHWPWVGDFEVERPTPQEIAEISVLILQREFKKYGIQLAYVSPQIVREFCLLGSQNRLTYARQKLAVLALHPQLQGGQVPEGIPQGLRLVRGKWEVFPVRRDHVAA